MISLGSYGGYVIFGFDHTVINVQGQKDFRVLGNAFILIYRSLRIKKEEAVNLGL